MSQAPSKAFVKVGDRWVHYRRCGDGPAIVLLHGSPNSSLAMEPLIQKLSDDFTCIALDTPGNGNSDPLDLDSPTTADYADALKDTLDALGLQRVAMYGFHTGAATAAAFIARWSDRVIAAVFDGVPLWTEEEISELLQGYLVDFEPKWDGSHLTWLWSRFLEQLIFFPWHKTSAKTRMNYDMSSPEIVHRSVMEFLDAGDHYQKPYAASLSESCATSIRRITVPTLITAHPHDPLAPHLDRLPPHHENIKVHKTKALERDTIWTDFHSWFKEHPADLPPSPPAAPAGLSRGYVSTPRGQLFWRGMLDHAEQPLVLLHDAGGSSGLFETVLPEIMKNRPVIAFDLPGQGDSLLTGEPCNSVESFADELEAALKNLKIEDAVGVGFHLGGQIAIELKRRGILQNAGIIGAPHYVTTEIKEHLKHYAPDLSISWDGSHLMKAWYFVRLRTLYYPWYKRDHTHIHWGDPHLDPIALHRQTVDLLKANNNHRQAYEAQFKYPTAVRMKAQDISTVFTVDFDPMSAQHRVNALQEAIGSTIDIISLPPAPTDWAQPLNDFTA